MRAAVFSLALFLAGAGIALTAKPAAPKTPYRTLDDIPRGVWYRGLPPAHLRDVTAWEQATQVDPPWIKIHGSDWLPAELAERFEWTRDPYATKPVTHPCRRGVE